METQKSLENLIFFWELDFFSVFVGEVVFFYFVDTLLYEEFSIIGEFFIFIGYPLMMAHIVINIRYFIERLDNFQKILLLVIPVSIILGYSLVTSESVEDTDENLLLSSFCVGIFYCFGTNRCCLYII